MPNPTALILQAPGTNCDRETAHAFELAGATVQMVHIRQLMEQPRIGKDVQIVCLPGGFSYGDDIAAGRILASQLRWHLTDLLEDMKQSDKLVLGICNGFQVLIQTGLLIDHNHGVQAQATLASNESGQFEDRWVHLAADNHRCVFLRSIERIYLPVAHAEGRFVAKHDTLIEELRRSHRVALSYCCGEDSDPTDDVPFPHNPNGSQGNVAGICDQSGRIFGLMPHPERFIDRTQHPRWTREPIADPGAGMQIFSNAVQYFS